MKNEITSHVSYPSPTFSTTAREWILSSALYDGIEDEDIRQIETLLVERGAKPNVLLPEYGITPFHLVVANENVRFAVKATDICLQHGADPNVRTEDGLTPVHLAAMWGCKEVLHILLASGGNPWLVDSFNKNAFDYAKSENQHECYNTLKMYCNSQPKPSGHNKSPYQMSLKRVILYKNDLQIVYEASPLSSKKCVSTQTSDTTVHSTFEEDTVNGFKDSITVSSKSHSDTTNNFLENKNKKLLGEEKKTNTKRKINEFDNNSGHTTINNKLNDFILNHEQNSTVFEYLRDSDPFFQDPVNGCVSKTLSSKYHSATSNNGFEDEHNELAREENKSIAKSNIHDNNSDHTKINMRLKDVIVNHRRNSTVFEYSPNKLSESSLSSDVDSLKVISSSREVTRSIVSELIEKLEETNKVRQSLNLNDDHGKLFKNVTQRKKRTNGFKPSLSSVGESSKNSVNNIGFVFDNSKNDSATFSRVEQSVESVNMESPPSIGFILDNLEDTSPHSRGSSLFSDIASDIEVCSAPPQDIHDDIMTEDDDSLDRKGSAKYSSSDSLYPYVSCDSANTREGDLTEYFESCLEKLPDGSGSDELVQRQLLHNVCEDELPSDHSVNPDISSVMDSITGTNNKTTPVNPKLVTSTPQKLSHSRDKSSFSSVVDEDSETSKAKWVEAKVSSSDEDQYISISEEYEYTDLDEGVVLIEKHYLVGDKTVSSNQRTKSRSDLVTTSESEASTISKSEGAYDTDELRRNLKEFGFLPGPINSKTKRVYLRKLKRFRKKPQPVPQNGVPAYSSELLKTLDASCEHLLFEWGHLEDSMVASFTCSQRLWREGQAKTSFTYLLLDPRVAHNLPAAAATNSHVHLWPDFLGSIFYVGKGKRSRPYAHLYEAVGAWQQQQSHNSKKIQRILDIWDSGQGVVCLHIFLNIIPVEAYTREAAMICALTLAEVTNEKAGEFYGSAACWNLRLKRRLGCVLLHRAFKVFLGEGERQLRPADIE